MATIGHSSPVAALRYQHATAERSKAIAGYLDDVISLAQSAQESALDRIVREEPRYGCHGGGLEHGEIVIGTSHLHNKKRRRAESNRRTGLCRPLPKPLGHAAAYQHERAASLTAGVTSPWMGPSGT